MSNIEIGLWSFPVLMLAIFLRVPIGLAMFLAGFLGLGIMGDPTPEFIQTFPAVIWFTGADDENTLRTFHFYLPMTVTHQKASWVPAMREFDQNIDYPGTPGRHPVSG